MRVTFKHLRRYDTTSNKSWLYGSRSGSELIGVLDRTVGITLLDEREKDHESGKEEAQTANNGPACSLGEHLGGSGHE